MFFNINAVNKIIEKFNITICEINEKNDNFTFFLVLFVSCVTFIFLSHFYVILIDYDNKIFV